MQTKVLSERGLHISIGLLSNLRPFFVTDPTDKEKVMCMCKLCLNFRLKFNALMSHSKRHGGESFDSISRYYMGSCACSKGENGYWTLKCVTGNCNKCKNKKLTVVPKLDEGELLSYNQFTVKTTAYICKKKQKTKKFNPNCQERPSKRRENGS
eukprot:TCONS_00039437-protein